MDMDYNRGLKQLRQRLLEGATGGQAPKEKNLESFVPARFQNSTPQESTEDILAKSVEWLSEIKKASTTYEEVDSDLGRIRPRPNPFTAALEGAMEEGFGRKKEATPEERKEAFISRRDKDSPSTYATVRPGEVTSFKQAIDLTEGGGGYDTLFGYSNKEGKHFDGFKVSNMTIGEIRAFSDPKGEYAQWVKDQLRKSGQKVRIATPMGRYQFVGSTLLGLAEQMNLSDDTVFSPEVQDRMFDFYLDQRINRGRTIEEKVSQVRQAWEGFKKIPDSTLRQLIMQREAK